MADENARSYATDPAPEFVGGDDARFTTDADLLAAGPPAVTVEDGDEPVVVPRHQWEPDRAESRAAAIYQAIGAGSVCWEDMSGTGVFQDDRATAIAEGLLAWLDEDERHRHPAGELERLQAKLDAEPAEEWSFDKAVNHPGPWQRWRQLDDGTWASDRYGFAPGLIVVVERRTPADVPFIHLIGRTQEINPAAARWLALRLAEATAIIEAANIP